MEIVHSALKKIAEATLGTPFENQVWLVGGAVRDELLGADHQDDFDLVTELDAIELAEFLFRVGVSSIEPVTYPRFGTALVRVEDANVEIVTARKESYDKTSRKPNVEPATLLDDAMRRDFTINTLRRNLQSDELVDPLGVGLADLEAKILRTPLDPILTFQDDPLRMLRAVRFRWKLGFEFAEGLEAAILESLDRLEIVSMERIKDEFAKMLVHPTADRALDDLMRLGLLDRFAPELRPMIGVEQGGYHHLDVWDHTMLVVKNGGRGDLLLSLGCLLHDVGKPATRFVDEEGNTRFFDHENVGEGIARTILQRLKFSNSDIETVASLVRNHMRLGSWLKWTDSAGRRLMRDLGENLDRLLKLIEADAASLKPGVRRLDLKPIRAKLAELEARTPVSTLRSPLSGEEIIEALGIEPGVEVGQAKALLEELVVEGELAADDKAGALARLKAWKTSR